jgi:flagellar hook assembly protein FlgD
VPKEFTLYPPYPNPFNPKTKIAFNVLKDSNIGLVIFDISGRLVRTFNISENGLGYHQIEWDAKDDQGSAVAAGVYFLRFNSETNYQVQKVILLK